MSQDQTGHGFTQNKGSGARSGGAAGELNETNGGAANQVPSSNANQVEPAKGANAEQARQRITSQLTNLGHQHCRRRRAHQHHQHKSFPQVRSSKSQSSMSSLPLPPSIGLPRANERRPILNDTYVYDDDDDSEWNAATTANPWTAQYDSAPAAFAPLFGAAPLMSLARNNVSQLYQAPTFDQTTGQWGTSQMPLGYSFPPQHSSAQSPSLVNARSTPSNLQPASSSAGNSVFVSSPGPTPPKASWILRTIMGGMQSQTPFPQSFLPPPRGRRNSFQAKGQAAQYDQDFDVNDWQQQYPREDDDDDDEGLALETPFDRHWRRKEDDNETKSGQNDSPGRH